MTLLFRTKLVLMVLGRYAWGDHVSDPAAFGLRLAAVLRDRDHLTLAGD